MLSIRKLIPAAVLAMSLAPLAANASVRATQPPVPSQSSAEQPYTLITYSNLRGSGAELPDAQPAIRKANVAARFMNAAPSNTLEDTAGG
jgi:hypothetical protein